MGGLHHVAGSARGADVRGTNPNTKLAIENGWETV